jgi:hypothetical protein
MPAMNARPNSTETRDICLLLRAHCEQRWLIYELVPLVRQLEQRSLPDEQLGLALAYLEALWIEAGGRAAETDALYAKLQTPAIDDVSLHEKARRYHTAVRRLRDALERRIDALLAVDSDVHDSRPLADRCAAS